MHQYILCTLQLRMICVKTTKVLSSVMSSTDLAELTFFALVTSTRSSHLLHQRAMNRTKEHQKGSLITLNGRNHVSESSSRHAPPLSEVHLRLNRLTYICGQLSL